MSSAATYTPAAADVGHYLYCVVQAAGLSDNVGQAYVRTPEIETMPAILGDLHVGGRLACTRGDWDDEEGARYPVTYAWYRESSGSGPGPVAIGTTNHHTVTFDDVGATVTCVVSAFGASQSSVQPEDAQPVLVASVDDDQPAPGDDPTVTRGCSTVARPRWG